MAPPTVPTFIAKLMHRLCGAFTQFEHFVYRTARISNFRYRSHHRYQQSPETRMTSYIGRPQCSEYEMTQKPDCFSADLVAVWTGSASWKGDVKMLRHLPLLSPSMPFHHLVKKHAICLKFGRCWYIICHDIMLISWASCENSIYRGKRLQHRICYASTSFRKLRIRVSDNHNIRNESKVIVYKATRIYGCNEYFKAIDQFSSPSPTLTIIWHT